MDKKRKMVALTEKAKSLLDLYVGMANSAGPKVTVSSAIEGLLEDHFANNPDKLELALKAAKKEVARLERELGALSRIPRKTGCDNDVIQRRS